MDFHMGWYWGDYPSYVWGPGHVPGEMIYLLVALVVGWAAIAFISSRWYPVATNERLYGFQLLVLGLLLGALVYAGAVLDGVKHADTDYQRATIGLVLVSIGVAFSRLRRRLEIPRVLAALFAPLVLVPTLLNGFMEFHYGGYELKVVPANVSINFHLMILLISVLLLTYLLQYRFPTREALSVDFDRVAIYVMIAGLFAVPFGSGVLYKILLALLFLLTSFAHLRGRLDVSGEWAVLLAPLSFLPLVVYLDVAATVFPPNPQRPAYQIRLIRNLLLLFSAYEVPNFLVWARQGGKRLFETYRGSVKTNLRRVLGDR
jgi:hypothetical protein